MSEPLNLLNSIGKKLSSLLMDYEFVQKTIIQSLANDRVNASHNAQKLNMNINNTVRKNFAMNHFKGLESKPTYG